VVAATLVTMRITFVKKILEDGSPCGKCADVDKRLHDSGQMAHIDHVAIADEREFNSEGMKLARQHSVKHAPFFIVEDDAGKVQIYTVYFKFVKEVLNAL
jgi:hypothetical protein